MTVISKEEKVVQEIGIEHLAKSRLSALAYWVSQIGSPPLTGAVTALLIAFTLSTPPAWRWAMFYIVLTILAPCAYIIWMVYVGKAVDFHLPNREQRIRPLQFTLVTALLTWLVLYQVQAPRLLQMLATVNGVQTAIFLMITFRWKISLHCTAATILSELAFVLFGTSAAPLTMSIPLIAWSRVHLERHTVGQTVGGVLLGAGILTPALFIYFF
jgi:membrane-associated phospholipid phosphatase